MTYRFIVKNGRTTISRDGKILLSIGYDGGLEVKLFYDFREAPLTLRAKADRGDSAAIVLCPCRVGLYVNGQLLDEEWGFGNISLDGEISGDIELEASESAPENKNPLLCGVKVDELRRPGVNVGDCMPFGDADGSFHLFWLYDRHHHCSKWGLGAHQWAHAKTTDLVHWDELPMAISITDPIEGSICTGSVIRCDDRYRAWYTVRMSDGSPARVSVAFSKDNREYMKSGDFFTLPERYHQPSARDPKAIFIDGRYHLLLTTTELSSGKGCLAHLVSDDPDMKDFEDLGPVIVWNDSSQPECPDWFEMGGRYYLVWSIGGRARYAFSDEPFGEGGWTIPEDNIIDCGSVPKSAVIGTDCEYKGERIFVGMVGEDGGYAGHVVMKRTVQKPDGRLEFVEI